MRITDKHILFWSEWPSNWYKTEFEAEVMIGDKKEKKTFYNSEQYFMYVKAITFKDYEIANRILKEGKNPRTAKNLGRLVKNYDDEVWSRMRYKVMVDANKAKYSQNEELKKLLLSDELKGKGFTESSPLDLCWGTGFAETHPDADDETKWKGQNLLGKALDEVRSWLLEQEKK